MANDRSRRKPDYQVRIAKERIDLLFDEASRIVKSDESMARRYIKLARKIGMRYNVRMPLAIKRKYCKYCHIYLLPGYNAKVSFKNKAVNIKCFSCNKTMHYPYAKRYKKLSVHKE